MKIELLPTAKLRVNPDNPRVIRDERFAKLVQSIREFPKMLEIRPIVVNADMMVLGGNMRLRACQEAGLKKVPVIRADELTEDEQRRFIIADNVAFGEHDWDTLANWDAEELVEWGLEIPDFSTKKEVVEDDYEVPDVIETDIVLGDLFEIGRHRLLCGDSTGAENVARLMDGAKPNLMVTDPPYGVGYDPEWRAEAGVNKNREKMGKVKNDDRADWRESYELAPCSVVYVWHDGRHAKTVQESIEACGFVVRNQIIWAKDRFALSRGNYHWQHEPCWYAVKKGQGAHFIGERNNSTLWEINSRDDGGHGHGTQKPVECMARPIRNHAGDVYDPFLGSGTTMVAAHQLDRTCFGMELDPKYCQVIIDRMSNLDPTLEIKRNGQPYPPEQ